jgi:hypothetical protein
MRFLFSLLALLGLANAATAEPAMPWPPAWVGPTEPTHIVGPIYFVGNAFARAKGLGALQYGRAPNVADGPT